MQRTSLINGTVVWGACARRCVDSMREDARMVGGCWLL